MTHDHVVAIDGPSGVGKTSVARGVATALGFVHLDTGAFYRAATVVALVKRVDLAIEAEVVAAVGAATLGFSDGAMTIEGIDMSQAIRSKVVTDLVSHVAAFPGVRRTLVQRQRDWVEANGGRAVVEGRDIGTAVFPDSPLKIYLTARPTVRAGRRAGETSGADVDDVHRDLARRDAKDSTRTASPLAAADDAVVLDTSDVSQADVIASVLALAHERKLDGRSSA